MNTFSLPNKQGLKFKVLQSMWLGTRKDSRTFSGVIVDKDETVVSTLEDNNSHPLEARIVFNLPEGMDPATLRLSLVDLELAGEILLVDESTGMGYADEYPFPQNERPDSTDDVA